MNKKNFKSDKTTFYLNDTLQESLHVPLVPPANTKIHFPPNPGSLRNFDFAPYYNKNCDQVVFECQRTIEILLSESIQSLGETLTTYTLVCYCNRGLKNFLNFCQLKAKSQKPKAKII